jgi:hypothetical protein
MKRPAPKPATTPIPVQLSEHEFTAFILPHLSMPRRGPKCTLGYHCVFNLILWDLYTGCYESFIFMYSAIHASRYTCIHTWRDACIHAIMLSVM